MVNSWHSTVAIKPYVTQYNPERATARNPPAKVTKGGPPIRSQKQQSCPAEAATWRYTEIAQRQDDTQGEALGFYFPPAHHSYLLFVLDRSSHWQRSLGDVVSKGQTLNNSSGSERSQINHRFIRGCWKKLLGLSFISFLFLKLSWPRAKLTTSDVTSSEPEETSKQVPLANTFHSSHAA